MKKKTKQRKTRTSLTERLDIRLSFQLLDFLQFVSDKYGMGGKASAARQIIQDARYYAVGQHGKMVVLRSTLIPTDEKKNNEKL